MKLTLLGNGVSIATARPFFKCITLPRASLFSTTGSASECEGGVSMVQGASRGIGLEFVKQLLEKNDKGFVIATCRNPSVATGLWELKNKFAQRLDIQKLDVTIESTIEDSANVIRDKYGSLNLLINASGVLSIPDVIYPETTLSKVQRSSLFLAYEINAVGPIMVCKHLWPLLKAGGSGTGREFAIVANLSARVGSIGDNNLGGWHSYRASKASLNQCINYYPSFAHFLDLSVEAGDKHLLMLLINIYSFAHVAHLMKFASLIVNRRMSNCVLIQISQKNICLPGLMLDYFPFLCFNPLSLD